MGTRDFDDAATVAAETAQLAQSLTERAKSQGELRLCTRCAKASFTCRACGARCCDHRAFAKKGDVATCGRCA